jgi:malate dehydrogenase (oxaloacetate-decarboxylating)
LETAGYKDIIVTDTKGAIYSGRPDITNNNPYKKEISLKTNSRKLRGTLQDVIKESDVFMVFLERPIF